MLEKAIKSTLEGVQDVSGHVYTAEALRDDAHTFAFYRIGSVREGDALDGFAGMFEATVEIHVVGRSQSDVAQASAQLTEQAKTMQGSTVSGLRVEQIRLEQRSPDLKETLVGLYRRMYVLTVWYQAA